MVRMVRKSLVIGLLAVLSLAGFAQGRTPPAKRGPKRPNIVFIMADDLGYAELGCYGQQKIKTPHLDRLASQGMRFMRHYSGAPVCAPSRCVLMTGKHPGHAYVRNNKEVRPEGQCPIPADEVTVAELLGGQGYVCGAFGKWGLGPNGSSGDPLKQGFDRFFGYNCQRHAHSYYPSYLWDDDKRIDLQNDPPVPGHARLAKDADPNDPRSYERFKGADYAPKRIADQALAFIAANKGKPFFLYYPTVIPHVALHVPDEEMKPYLGQWAETPLSRASYTPHFTPRAAYAAMITYMDKQVGRILAKLDELGLAENTIVVFTSDNGATYLRDADYKFFESVGPLRGLKGSIYEGGVRVPAIVRYPGRVRPGSTTDRISGFEDWMPTLLELAGSAGTAPAGTDGISLAATLRSQSQEARPFLYREFSGYTGQQALWMNQWKAVRRGLSKGTIETELYDLDKDVAESKDLAADHPDVVAKMEAIMAQQHTPSELFPIKALERE